MLNLELISTQNLQKKSLMDKKSQQTLPAFKSQVFKTDVNNATMSLDNLQAIFLPQKNKISFGRKLEDHMSYGANVLPNGKVSFKVWGPNIDTLKVHVRSKDGQTPRDDHTSEEKVAIFEQKNKTCGEWVYKTEEVAFNKWHYLYGKEENAHVEVMKKDPKTGYHEIILDNVKPGDMYKFVSFDKDGNELKSLKDPRSKSQPFDIHGWSEVYDENAYTWKNDKAWEKHSNKIRNADGPTNLKPPSKMVVNEIHIGTFTKEGNFEAAMKKLEEVAKDGIFNTVHVMPVNEFYGERNWGYEGVDLFATESSYGGPDKFKQFVDRAHELGINVLLDVVYNHMGPFYNVVGEYGKYFDDKKGTPWGGAMNYEGKEGGKEVRNFIVDNALHWLKNYNIDALRLDMTQFMMSDIALKELAFEVRKHKPESVLITEDGRNSRRVVRPLKSEEFNNDPAQELNVNDIAGDGWTNSGRLYDLGYDAQWNFDFQHTLESLATNNKVMNDFYPSVGDLAQEMKYNFRWSANDGVDLPLPQGHTNMNYVMSHDEAGNRDGTRLITKILQNRLGLFNHLKSLGYDDCRAGQGAAAIAVELQKAFTTGDDRDFSNIVRGNKLNVTKESFAARLEESKSINKVAIGAVFVAPGPKMMLMGDERGELAPFKFFSQYPVEKLAEKISGPGDKGYLINERAFEASKVDQEGATDPKMKKFTQDLAKLFYNNPCLHNGDNTKVQTVVHEQSKVLGIHRYEGDNELFTVLNFGECECGDYGIAFPKGKWQQVLSSNEEQYGGYGDCMNKDILKGHGTTAKTPIEIARHSMVVFKRVG